MVSGNRIVVAGRGADRALWHKWYDNGWSDWHSLEGLSQSASAAFLSRSMQGMVVCRGNDGAIYERHYAGGWTPWASGGPPSTIRPLPSPASPRIQRSPMVEAPPSIARRRGTSSAPLRHA